MSNGLGAGFGGLMLYAVLLIIAGGLLVTTVVAFYWRNRTLPAPLQYVAVGLVGAVVVVAAFAIVALADEAPALAALFVVTAGLPLVLVAGRARWTGASWSTVAAVTGMAWCLPFLVGIGVLFGMILYTDISPTVTTAIVGTLTMGGAVLAGEYVGSVLYPDYASTIRS